VYIKASNATPFGSVPTTLRCPHCRREGTFFGFAQIADAQIGEYKVAHRICPNPKCQGHIFVVLSSRSGELVTSYPPERIDFDTADIPQKIVASFEEALTCHANGCFIAAAMLVRKTLEVLCEDRGALGADLRARIQSLRTKVILPEALFEAIDHLRLLGNDAAHIESKTYSDVGVEEVVAAIALTKEILKAVYQYDTLLTALKALKK